MTLFEEMERTAVLSGCGRYRYSLTRRWGDRAPFAAFVMLNPSTADAEKDDPTIRRCIGFAKSWGYEAIEVVNLFALLSSKPRDLRDSHEAGIDPVGPGNDQRIEEVCRRAARCIAAWGAHAFAEERARRVFDLCGPVVECLGTTLHGCPRHPLYVLKDQAPVRFDPR